MKLTRRGFLGTSAILLGGGASAAFGQADAPNIVLIKNARLFDGSGTPPADAHILIEGSRIKAISRSAVAPPESARVYDAAGRIVMPGLTDAHWHMVKAANVMENFAAADDGMYFAAMVAEAQKQLLRGFTTIRDCGGPTFGLKAAIDAGIVPGPRIFPSGALISQTAGHGDHAPPYARAKSLGGEPSRYATMGLEIVANGVPEVLTAAREQLRKGASQIKVAASGGVLSDFDPIDSLQFSRDELVAAAQSARDWGTYATAHAYTPGAVRRCIDAGMACIEHGHLLDEATVALMGEKGIWLSVQPFTRGDQPVDERYRRKGERVNGAYENLLRWAAKHGTRVAFGTDLVFQPGSRMETQMLTQFTTVYSNLETLRIATSGNAELFEMAGDRNPYKDARLGILRPGAWADLLILRENPIEDPRILIDHERNIQLVMKNGLIFKDIT